VGTSLLPPPQLSFIITMKIQQLIDYLTQAQQKMGNVDVYLIHEDERGSLDEANEFVDIIMKGEQSLMNKNSKDDDETCVVIKYC
jgi:hypothetical protein